MGQKCKPDIFLFFIEIIYRLNSANVYQGNSINIIIYDICIRSKYAIYNLLNIHLIMPIKRFCGSNSFHVYPLSNKDFLYCKKKNLHIQPE